MKRRLLIGLGALALLAAALYFVALRHGQEVLLTGIVTTDEVIVSAEVQGRLQRLLVNQGETVKTNQLLALIQPQEWEADLAFYAHSEQQSVAQEAQAEADLKFQESQTTNQIGQAEANLAATEAQVAQAQADLEIARLNLQRADDLYKQRVESVQTYDQARTACDAAK